MTDLFTAVATPAKADFQALMGKAQKSADYLGDAREALAGFREDVGEVAADLTPSSWAISWASSTARMPKHRC